MLTASLSYKSTAYHQKNREELNAVEAQQKAAVEHKAKEVQELTTALKAPLIGGIFNAAIAQNNHIALRACQEKIIKLQADVAVCQADYRKITEQMNQFNPREQLTDEFKAVLNTLTLSMTQEQMLSQQLNLCRHQETELKLACDELKPIEKPVSRFSRWLGR